MNYTEMGRILNIQVIFQHFCYLAFLLQMIALCARVVYTFLIIFA